MYEISTSLDGYLYKVFIVAENGPKAGSAGEKNCKLITTDKLVLDIIEQQSPIVQDF